MMIVEQPGINVAFAQGRLNGRQVHGQTSIVNKGTELREWAHDKWGLGRGPVLIPKHFRFFPTLFRIVIRRSEATSNLLLLGC
jgi:hypothetical protein